jgi:hypothetical protein
MTARCVDCGGTVRWAPTIGGRRLPLDIEPDPAGTVILDGHEEGKVRVLTGDELPAQQTAWRLHLCPARARCMACKGPMDRWLPEHGYSRHIGCLLPLSLRESIEAERRRLASGAPGV